jgi:5-methylcytosine-specific restriction endonuclease McrBC regulatory subunit McrC
MNSLFEEFITEFMKKNKNEINLSIKSIDSQSSNKYLFNENKFKLKPDIIINYYNNLRIIIDTKYKKLNLEKNYF